MIFKLVRKQLRFSLPFMALAALVSAGCSDASNGRLGVTGTVSYQGSPLDGADINFLPIDEGASSGGSIVNGDFSITGKHGLRPGEYRVEIEKWEPTGKKVPVEDAPDEMMDITEQVIPAKYNEESELRMDIKTGAKNHKDFVLE